MRILIVHGAGPGKYPSGEISVIERESEYLQHKGHLVSTVIDNGGLGWNPFRLFWFPKKNRILRETILSFQPDIVHFHSVIPYLGLSILALPRNYGIPIVQTLHNGRWICVEGGYFRDGHYCRKCVGNNGWQGVIKGCGRGYLPSFFLFLVNLFARFQGRLFRWVNRFIAVSDFVQKQHLLSGFPEEKIIVNNNGIDFSPCQKNAFSKSWKQREGVAFAGRVSIAKGANVLKFLIPLIKQPLHVVGSGTELDELKQFCKQKNYKHVCFWGKQSREKTLEILGGVICTIVPSQCGDSFPTVALESMALGTPVVASDVGGLSGLVGSRGAIVDAEDYEQFAGAVLNYLERPDIAEADGNISLKYVHEHLTMSVRGEKLIEVYEELLNTG